MNIIIDDPHFLPHCRSQLSLILEKSKLNLIKGVNGIGKSTFASAAKERYPEGTTLIEQSALHHFYNRTLRELKKIFVNANPAGFDEKMLDKVWHALELDKIEDHHVHRLSGGENQSLKLALGLSVKKELMIIDEPSQYLDFTRKVKLAEIFNDLMKESYLLIIEHESSWLKDLPQKIAVFYIEEGVLKAKYD